MAIVGVNKNKLRSVIICQSREFKAKAVSMLNGAAFPAEKFTFANFEEGIERLNSDRLVQNLVIEGAMLSPDKLKAALTEFAKDCYNENIKALVYLDEAQQAEAQAFKKILPKAKFAPLPLMQAHFNGTFHDKASSNGGQKKVPAKKATSPKSSAQLSLIEASAHIKDTIDMINDLIRDRGNLELVAQIAQRFNGLIGAFHFFNNKAGYPQLRSLAELIDAVGRTYEDSQQTEIKGDHFQILVDAARCSYLILKDMRDGKDIGQERLTSHQKLINTFHEQKDLKRRQSQNQSEVDSMIAEALQKSS